MLHPLFMAFVFILSSFFSSDLEGARVPQEVKDEVVVRLETERKLLPVYLSELWADQGSLGVNYVKELDEILQFDLRYNGVTELRKREQRWEGLARGASISRELWKEARVYYIIQCQIQNHQLSARVTSISNGEVKGVDGIELTGKMSEDRQKIHQLADSIHGVIFGRPGIASSRILYTVRLPNPRKPKEWLSEVWTADWDGGNARQVTQNSGYCVTPSYLPPEPGYRSGNFVYVAYHTAQPKVYLGDFKGGAPKRLLGIRGNQLMPTLSPDRKYLAFVCDATGNPDLFLQPFDPQKGPIGRPYQAYATVYGTQASPTFHPNGRQIAFVSNKDGAPRIYTMPLPRPGSRLKDIKPQMLTKMSRENTSPCWSPDGSKIAYSAMTGGTRQIWVVDVYTGKERQVTKGPGHKENPSWAPNSLHLLFNREQGDSSELCIVNLNQPQAVQITSGIGQKRFPSWERF